MLTGGSCCVAPGRRPFRLTTVGPVPTAAMCGTVSTCQASSAKVSVKFVIAVDCFGSINARQLGLFEAEVCSILAGQQPRLVYVLYFDTEVQKVETYQAGQPVKLAPVGGGGTDFRPGVRWLEERGITPQTLVFLTDLWGSFPSTSPGYPVLRATTKVHHAPFG